MEKYNCPNGHSLRVDERHFGRRAECPRCHVRFMVPAAAKAVSESSIMRVLGPADMGDEAVVSKAFSSYTPKSQKTCPKCKCSMSAGFSICPHCRVYLPNQAM